MTQPIRAYTCPYCGPSIVSLLPGESWWDTCPNLTTLVIQYPDGKVEHTDNLWVCGCWIKSRKVGALVEGVAGVLGYTTKAPWYEHCAECERLGCLCVMHDPYV